MNVTAIIIAALVVGAVGIILGFFLGISGEKFKVEVDPREEAILDMPDAPDLLPPLQRERHR